MKLFAGSGHRPLPPDHIDHAELSGLEADLLAAVGGRTAFDDKLRSFFRSAIDEVIDTARTGRYFLSQLEKTEKTYLGTKFEILLRDWLQVPRGVHLDLLIGGREVDVKSTTGGKFGWMIPPEAIDRLCILLRVNEEDSLCSVGLVRARPDYLNPSQNRDAKRTISAAGRKAIWWLSYDTSYTPNFWNRITPDLRDRIMSQKGGAKRLAALFENCIGIPISRVLIAGIAAQDDYMKRLRRNGGARDALAQKGIAILYEGYDRQLLRELGIVIGTREFISHRAANAEEAQLLTSAGKIESPPPQ